METAQAESPSDYRAMEIRVRGLVQGVGFRPAVWRAARERDLAGEVLNDARGVLLRVGGPARQIADLLASLAREPPPLARIESIESRAFAGALPRAFRIAPSEAGEAHTEVAPDARLCAACAREIADPAARRYRYPFANCTHCGPRLGIVTGIPYGRDATTMAAFPMCADCEREYRDPADRRFHAEAIACPACGPKVRLIRLDGEAIPLDRQQGLDEIDLVCGLLQQGETVAVQGLGGFHLACDASDPEAVAALRRRKRRDAKPFALMARDLAMIRRYAAVDEEAARWLESPAAPIVILAAGGPERLAEGVAPGLKTLGFMLPTAPLHALILQRMAHPLVMTSGNLSDEPPAIDEGCARQRLAGIAEFALVHDRPIAMRIDDSLVRVMGGRARVLRRARGFAPAPIPLPPGFERAPALLAFGGELKATFCLVEDGAAVLSQHLGDLENAATFDDYRRSLALYARLFDHAPAALVADSHPDYLSTKLAKGRARDEGLPLIEAQHHHAHLASCLAENGRPLDAPPVLAIVLDGLGLGDDGTLWGGEFLLGDYRGYERLARLKPAPILGGAQAAREPWRNLYAQIATGIGWRGFADRFAGLELHADLAGRPRATLDAMLRNGVNAPMASSCGRLFDAVAAALGLCRERQAYEGEAAARLEAIVDRAALGGDREAAAYPFAIARDAGVWTLDPLPMWRALLDDLACGAPAALIAARFHDGLAGAIAETAVALAWGTRRFDTVALSGGCFQNEVLLEATLSRLERASFTVLTQARVPAGDGGLALGQAAIGAARLIFARGGSEREGARCV